MNRLSQIGELIINGLLHVHVILNRTQLHLHLDNVGKLKLN